MYDRSNCGGKLRKYTSVSLAWWHNYKWATKQIFRVFSSDIMAPLFHHLFPDRKLHVDELSLPSMVTYFNYIRLAYPAFMSNLLNAISVQDLTPRQRTILINIRDLCEFFIPVVYIHIYTYIYIFNLIVV